MSKADSTSLEALVQRVGRLEAIEEIRKLKLQYATLCDEGYPGDKIAALYTEDAVFDGGPFGRYEGREAISGFYTATGERMLWAIHFMTNDVIDVADDLQTATGVWYLPNAISLKGEDDQVRPIWLFGIERDEYRCVQGTWRFTKTTFEMGAAFDSRVGWHEQRVQI